jgi:transaldolase
MRGAKRLDRTDSLKSVYSIFVSRVDVYTQQHAPQLGIAQGQVGIVGAKQIWAENEAYWPDKKLALKQEIVFASTGTKTRDDPPWKYVDALAGSDIQTNPPGTNAAVQASGRTFSRRIDTLIEDDVRADIREHVDVEHLESTLMREGVEKFADPQKALLELIARRRVELTVDP